MHRGRPVSALRAERVAQGLRLVDLASKAEVSNGMLSMIENGYVPRSAVCTRIADALGCPATQFWPEAS